MIDPISVIETIAFVREVVRKALSLTENNAPDYKKDLGYGYSRLEKCERDLYESIVTIAEFLRKLSMLKTALSHCRYLRKCYMAKEIDYNQIDITRKKIIDILDKLEKKSDEGGKTK
jgi:hypothetical protein